MATRLPKRSISYLESRNPLHFGSTRVGNYTPWYLGSTWEPAWRLCLPSHRQFYGGRASFEQSQALPGIENIP